MESTARLKPAPMNGRLVAALFAVAVLGVIGIARWLTPDPRGLGTHEQLGLPPCVSERFLGFPCPLCGMTTSFSLMAHARPGDAFYAQPAGAAAFLVALVLLSGGIVTACTGHLPTTVRRIAVSRGAIFFAILVLVVSWCYKLWQTVA